MTLTCVVCTTEFGRPGRHGPVPLYCSIVCKSRQARRRPERLGYERRYRARLRKAGRLATYEYEYNRRPAVVERQSLRWRGLFGDPGLPIPSPYSGHRWLDMARAVVGSPNPEAPWADDAYDDMGEAVLALLEGRDMKAAVSAYRKQEYVSRRMTIRMDDWRAADDYEHRWFESIMPKAQSAEDEYMQKVVPVRAPDAGYHHGRNRRRFGNNRGRQQPSERRKRAA